MTFFYLLRHGAHRAGGETIAGRMPGVLLSPLGEEQVRELAERLSCRPISALYCSPVERTRATADRIGERLGLPVQLADELLEVDFGDWSGQTLDDLRPRDDWRRWNSFRSGARAPGGELMLETQLRVVSLMQRLTEAHPDAHVALVTHGDVIRAALAYWLGIPLDLFTRLEISLASVSIVAIAEYGPWVLCVNHAGALPELAE